MVYFQFCGSSKVETEFGVYEMEPGDVMLVPGGIAHHSIGRNDSLRYFCQSHEAVDYVMNEDQYTSLTSFEVKRIGGPNWGAPQTAPTKGPVLEKMHFWDDGPDDQTVVERDYESLIGVAGINKQCPTITSVWKFLRLGDGSHRCRTVAGARRRLDKPSALR